MKDYYDLLEDPRWKIKSRIIKKRDGHLCVNCKAGTNLVIHHEFYVADKRAPWLYEDCYLSTLCRPCHHNEHFEADGTKKPLVIISLKQYQLLTKYMRVRTDTEEYLLSDLYGDEPFFIEDVVHYPIREVEKMYSHLKECLNNLELSKKETNA